MKGVFFLALIFLFFPGIYAHTESFRTNVSGTVEVTPERQAESPVIMGVDGSVIISLGAGGSRFLRGVELEITAPQAWLNYRGTIVMMMYNNITPENASDIADFDGRRIAFEPLPARLRNIYHIPIRQQHGLRTSTSITVPTGVIQPDTFPIIFRLLPVEKGLSAAFDQLTFNVTARPILSDEGAVRLAFRFPPQQRNRPFTVLINDNVISNTSEEIILREGEHHLVILSDDYRNESRRFHVERAKIIDLIIELQDPTPVIIFEGPQNAVISLNNTPIQNIREPVMIDPGIHEVRFKIGDYTIIRTLNVQRGKTYRVALEVDLAIYEED